MFCSRSSPEYFRLWRAAGNSRLRELLDWEEAHHTVVKAAEIVFSSIWLHTTMLSIPLQNVKFPLAKEKCMAGILLVPGRTATSGARTGGRP
jgi:hypothetical protein